MVALDYSVGGLAGFAIAVMSISTGAIILRFWSRGILPGVRYDWDDWLALAGWAPDVALCVCILDGWRRGLGKHLTELTLDETSYLLKLIFAGDIAFDLSITLSKISALAFYARVFRVRSNNSAAWRWALYTVMGLAVAWFVAQMIYTPLQCTPIHKYWDPLVPGTCIGQTLTFLSSAISSVIIDIFVLLIPLPQIFNLSMQTSRKLLLGGTFIVGYAAAFMSLGRLVTAASLGDALTLDVSHSLVPILYWSSAECGLSTLAICLPSIFQLTKRAYNFGFLSLLSSRDYSKYESQRRLQPGHENPHPVDSTMRSRRYLPWKSWGGMDSVSNDTDHLTKYPSRGQELDTLYPPNAIHIQNQVSVGKQTV